MSDKPHRWDELTAAQKGRVKTYIDTILAEKPEKPTQPARVIGQHTEQQRGQTVTYQLERVQCGKKKCKCTTGDLHGPYWYAYWRKDGQSNRKYIGKKFKRIPNDAL